MQNREILRELEGESVNFSVSEGRRTKKFPEGSALQKEYRVAWPTNKQEEYNVVQQGQEEEGEGFFYLVNEQRGNGLDTSYDG